MKSRTFSHQDVLNRMTSKQGRTIVTVNDDGSSHESLDERNLALNGG